MNCSKYSLQLSHILVIFAIFLNGCGGGGSGGGSSTVTSTTPVVNSTFISGTYSFQTSSNSISKTSVQKASSVLSNDYNLSLFDVNGNSVIAETQVFTNGDFLIKIDNSNLNFDPTKYYVIKLVHKTNSIALSQVFQGITKDRDPNHTLNLDSLIQVKAVERELVNQFLEQDPNFKPHLFALGEVSNSLDSNAPQVLGKQVSSLINGTQVKVNISDIQDLINQTNSPLKIYKDIGQNLITFSSDLPANRGFDLAFNDLLECVNINISCQYPIVANKVKNKIGGEQAIREGLEAVFLTNQNSIINKQIEQYPNLDDATKSHYSNSQVKLHTLLNTVNLNPESSFRLSLINESLNHVMKSYLEIPTSFDLNAYKRHRDYIKEVSEAITPVPALPLPNDLDDLLLTIRQATFNNGYALSELTQLTKDGLLAEREIGENLAISFTSLALLSEFVNSSKRTDLETFALSSVDAIMKGIEQSSNDPEQTKASLIQKISRLVGRDYSNSTIKQGIFSPPRLVLTASFQSNLASSNIFKNSIPISFSLTKAISNVTTNLKASYSIDNGVNFSPLNATNSQGTNYTGNIFGLNAGPIPIVNIITWDSVRDIQKTSVSDVIVDLQVYDHFSIGEVVRFVIKQISNNNGPDLTSLLTASSYNDGNTNIVTNNIPETIGSNNTPNTITLDATLATDVDEGDLNGLNYQWTQTSGPNVTINNPTSKVANFLSPNILSNSLISIKLVVTDPKGAKSTKTFPINILFKNNAPNIVLEVTSPNISTIIIPENIMAGNIVIGNTIKMNLAASNDIDNNPITYQWFSEDPTNFMTASIRSFAPFTTASFIVPSSPYYRSGGKTIPLRIEATDLPPSDRSLKVSRNVTFTVIFDDRLPTPVPSPQNLQWLETAGAFELDALQSSDPDGAPVTHVWEFYPNDSTPGISARYFSANPSVDATNPNKIDQFKKGIIRINPFNVKPEESSIKLAFKLTVQAIEQLENGTVTGNLTGLPASTIVTVTVIAVDEQSPQIVSMSPTVFTTSESLDGIHYQQVFLNASACLADNNLCDVNSNGSIALTYLWEQVQGNKTLAFTNPNSPQTSFVAPNVEPKTINDLYKIKLTVTNPNANNNSSLPSSITSIVNVSVSYVNFKPSSLSVGASTLLTDELISSSSVAPIVYLTAKAIDPDQLSLIPQTVIYNWAQTAGTPQVSLQNINSTDVSFAPPNITTDTRFTFQVQILDGIAPVDPQPRQASDALTKEISVFVRYVNTPPTLISSAEVIVNEGEPFTISASGYDSETPLNSLNFKWLNDVGEVVSNTASYTSSSASDVTRNQGSRATLYTVEVCDLGNSSLNDVQCKQKTVTVRRVFKNNSPISSFTLQPNVVSENNSSFSADLLERAHLNGGFSYDPDFDSLRYLWSASALLGNKHYPEIHGFIQSLSDSQPSAQFIPTDVCHDERYNLSLVVEDDLSNTPSQADVKMVTVKAVNRAPVIQNISFQNVGTKIIQMTAQVSDPDNDSVSLPCAQPFRYTWTTLTSSLVNASFSQLNHGCLEKVGLICINGNQKHVYNPGIPTTESVANFHLTGLSTNGAFTDTLYFRLQVDDASGSALPATTSLIFTVKGGTFSSLSKLSKNVITKTKKQSKDPVYIKGLGEQYSKTNSPILFKASFLNKDHKTKKYRWSFSNAPSTLYIDTLLSTSNFYQFAPTLSGEYTISCDVTSSDGTHSVSSVQFKVLDSPEGSIQIIPNLGSFTNSYYLTNVDYNLWNDSKFFHKDKELDKVHELPLDIGTITIQPPLYEERYSYDQTMVTSHLQFSQHLNINSASWIHKNSYYEKLENSILQLDYAGDVSFRHYPKEYLNSDKIVLTEFDSFLILKNKTLIHYHKHMPYTVLENVQAFYLFKSMIFALQNAKLVMLTFNNTNPQLVYENVSHIKNSLDHILFLDNQNLYALRVSDQSIHLIQNNITLYYVNYSENLVSYIFDNRIITYNLTTNTTVSNTYQQQDLDQQLIFYRGKPLVVNGNRLVSASDGSVFYQHSDSIIDVFTLQEELFLKDKTSVYKLHLLINKDSFERITLIPFDINTIEDSLFIDSKLYLLADQKLYSFHNNQFDKLYFHQNIQDIYVSNNNLHVISNGKHHELYDNKKWSYVNFSTPSNINIVEINDNIVLRKEGVESSVSLEIHSPALSIEIESPYGRKHPKVQTHISKDNQSFTAVLIQ